MSEEKNCTSGIKRTLSEGCGNGEQTIKRDGKRPKMDQGELEAQLELKITAKAGSHHKLEKVSVQFYRFFNLVGGHEECNHFCRYLELLCRAFESITTYYLSM